MKNIFIATTMLIAGNSCAAKPIHGWLWNSMNIRQIPRGSVFSEFSYKFNSGRIYFLFDVRSHKLLFLEVDGRNGNDSDTMLDMDEDDFKSVYSLDGAIYIFHSEEKTLISNGQIYKWFNLKKGDQIEIDGNRLRVDMTGRNHLFARYK